ncbi:EAL domain-containing protein [Oceanobacillus manasiensis]|uniref:EAL domain-containing protein n=1 Tax=Oceanobacillus manasiensis TaxID=586413 RepID=UPI0005A61246|nr:EAL domain-containing protein [Oceanobacillus manasiensis]
MFCDICQPKPRGYTVYFAEDQEAKLLLKYIEGKPENHWGPINDRMFWVKETIFFNMMDYVEAHLNSESIYAVESDKVDPLKTLYKMKPIQQFQEEREASWIDGIIQDSQLTTHYQPIINRKNGEPHIIGYELLSRGIDQDGGVIPPFNLFEAARVRNRMFALDRACRLQAVRNAATLPSDKLIFINFIPTAIYVPEHCLATTFAIVKKLNMKPEQVVFEVVETDEVEDIEHLKSILDYYRKHGFKYALDDVGTGFNDLQKLADLKPDIVKLAMEFSNGISTDKFKQEVASSVLKLSKEVGAQTLAEGVETEEDYNYLSEMGYELFQGYYFAKPTPTPIETLNLEKDGRPDHTHDNSRI